jgi:hypothetical protein
MRRAWSDAEVAALRRGHARHGHKHNVWAAILADPELKDSFDPKRTGVNLKDKWRIMFGDRVSTLPDLKGFRGGGGGSGGGGGRGGGGGGGGDDGFFY